MKKGIFLLVCLIGMVSCVDHKDAFDPNAEAEKKKEDYDKNFPVTDVDPEQDWSTFTKAKVSVTVNEDWGETYVIKVYTDNPLVEASEALLLAEGEVKNGDTFSVDIEMPKDLSGVFVSRTDAKGACLLKYAILEEDRIVLTFGELVKKRNAQPRGLSLDNQAREAPYSESSIVDYLQKAEVIPQNSDLHWNSGYYKVIENVTYDSFAMQASDSNKGLWLIIDGGATVTIKEGTMTNDNVHLIIYNGTLDIEKSFDATSTGPEVVVCSNGKITGNGAFMITNNWGGDTDKMLYNAGTIDIHSLTVNGGAYYNCGMTDVTVFHNTTNGGKLVNFGSVTIDEAYIQNMTIYNSCKMHVKTNNLEGSEFKDCYLADGAYLEVENTLKTGSGSKIYLGNGAILNVGVYLSNNSSIHGVDSSSENAYIKFGKVEGNTFGTSTGYYTIDAGDYTALSDWSKGQFEDNTLKLSGASLGNLTVSSPFKNSDSCSGEVSIGSNDKEDKENYAYYAFEDLGSVGDYDFNDVILKVSHVLGSSQATVELVAAGGTLATAVKYGNEVLWSEVHEAFGVELSTMVNTGRGTAAQEPQAKTIAVASNASFKDLKFAIVVTYSNGNSISIVESVPSIGSAPQYLYVPATWRWPKENVRITQAYAQEGHSFEEWAQNANQAKDWYEHPTNDKVH